MCCDVADGLEGWRVVLSSLPAVWEDVKTAAADAWDGVCAFWAGAAEWFDRTVLTPLSEGWETFRDGFSTLWSGITELVKQEVNGIIGFINSMIAAAVDGINAVIALLNGLSFTVPDWVPALGGMQWGFDLPTFTAPQIPLLAQGAVLPANRPFLAVVGDQRSGTNVEAPLELIRATVQEANADLMAQVIGALRSAPDSERPIQVELLLDGRKLASVLAKRSKEQGAGLMGSQVYSY